MLELESDMNAEICT